MKKLLSLTLALLLILSLCACTPSPPEISDHPWSLASVTQTDDRGAETILYVSEGYVNFFGEGEELPRINCQLTAKRGSFTIQNLETDEVYEGIYENEDEFSPDTMYYEIVLSRRKGSALCVRAADSDGNDFYMLSLSVGNYTLLFFQ